MALISSLKKKNGHVPAVIVLALILSCQMAALALLPDPAPAASAEGPPPVVVREGWQYRWGDSPVDGTGVPLWAREVYPGPGWKDASIPGKIPSRNDSRFLWLRVMLPEGRWSDPCLYITKVYQTFELYQGGELIYRYGGLSQDPPGKYGGFFQWHVIPLKDTERERIISFRIYSGDINKIGITRNVTLGSKDDIYKKMVNDGAGRLVAGSALVFIGLFASFLYLFNRREAVYLVFGAASLSGGVFCIALSRINQILIPDPLFWSYATVIFLFPRPALEFLMIEYLFGQGYKKYIRRLWQVNLAVAAALLAWALFSADNLIAAMGAFELLQGAAILFQIVIVARLLSKSTDGRIFALGFSLMLLAGLHDILVDNQIISVSRYVSHWGDLSHLAAIALIIIRRFWEVHSKVRIYSGELEAKSRDLEVKNAELSRIDRLKDEFLANTSHELRTPLNGIIGLADSMIHGATGPLTGPQAENLSMIASSGRRLLNLINDILDFTRLKNRDIQLHKKPADIRQITGLVICLTMPLAAAKGLKIQNLIEEEVPLVNADESRLEQIMYNLIGNSVKFTDSGGVTICARQRDELLEITVADSGIGIQPDKLDSVYNSFTQADASATRKHGGAGLGLSITKQLVELHGGSIRAESAPGVGTSITFTLPVCREPREAGENDRAPAAPVRCDGEAAAAGIPEQAIPASEFKILVADDEPVNLQVLVNYLTLQNYSVTTAKNGEEALALIEKESGFDLVILDLMMPKISGYEVCHTLRRSYSRLEMPVLMITAKNRPGDIEAGFQAGANDYITKPFDRRELLARVGTLLDLKRSLKQAVLNAQRLEAEWQRRLLAEKLNEFTQKMTSTLDLSEVLNGLLEHLRKIVDYHGALVLLKEDNGFRVVFAAGISAGQDARYALPGSTSLLEEIIQGRDPVIMDDIQMDSRFKGLGLNENLRSWMAIPVFSRNGLAAIIVLHHRYPGIYNESHAAAALTFAAQAGIAIDNARLFAEVKSLAITDALTGLYNRRYFFDFANHEYDRSRRYNTPLSLIMLDIDHFKRVNDSHGHATGDEILKAVAGRCLSAVRQADIVGRYGGEEFVILLPETGPREALAAAERLRGCFENRPIATEANLSISITVSLGVCSLSPEMQNLQEMLEKVDEGLYEAKKDGRNRVVLK